MTFCGTATTTATFGTPGGWRARATTRLPTSSRARPPRVVDDASDAVLGGELGLFNMRPTSVAVGVSQFGP
jgi:hypothetical protein